LQICIDLEMNL